MAVDLRVPRGPSCRNWLETRLLGLEEADLLDVTREQRPPHYHIALFPSAYRAHVEALLAEKARLAAEQARADSLVAARPPDEEPASAAADGRGVPPYAIAGLPLLALALIGVHLGRARGRNDAGMI